MTKRTEELGDIATEVLFENEKVKIWNLVVEPGRTSAWHLHGRDYVTVTTEGGRVSLELEDPETGEVTSRSSESPVGGWQFHGDHQVHRVVNNSDTRHQNLLIELKG